MKRGRFRVFGGPIRRGKETQQGVGQALRDAMPDPMELGADDAMERCIKALDEVEQTLAAQLRGGRNGSFEGEAGR